VAFAVAAAVLFLTRPSPERWRQAWVFLVPVIAFGTWYLFFRGPALDSVPLSEQLGDVPRFEFQSLTAMVAAATGSFRSPFSRQIDFLNTLTYLVATITFVAVGVRAMTSRLPATFWALLGALLVLFAAPASAPGELRTPTASRYVLPGVVILLLLICEALRGVRITSTSVRLAVAGVVAVVAAFAIYSNAWVLERSAKSWGTRGVQVRAELTALDLAGARVERGFVAEDPLATPPIPFTHAGLSAAQYFAVKGAFGSPAFSPEELQSQPIVDRDIADIVLARALRLQLAATPTPDWSTAVSVPRVVTTSGTARTDGGCITVTPRHSHAASQIALPAGGGALSANGRIPVNLALGRFGPGYSIRCRHSSPARRAS